MYSMCTCLCFCLSLSHDPLLLPSLAPAVSHRQTHPPSHFYLPFETPELGNSYFSSNKSLPPQVSPTTCFFLRFLLLLSMSCFTFNVCKISFSAMIQTLDLSAHLPQTPVHSSGSSQLLQSSQGLQQMTFFPHHDCMHPKLLHSNNYYIQTTLATTSMISPSESPL